MEFMRTIIDSFTGRIRTVPFTRNERKLIGDEIRHYHRNTTVRFRELTEEFNNICIYLNNARRDAVCFYNYDMVLVNNFIRHSGDISHRIDRLEFVHAQRIMDINGNAHYINSSISVMEIMRNRFNFFNSINFLINIFIYRKFHRFKSNNYKL